MSEEPFSEAPNNEDLRQTHYVSFLALSFLGRSCIFTLLLHFHVKTGCEAQIAICSIARTELLKGWTGRLKITYIYARFLICSM